MQVTQTLNALADESAAGDSYHPTRIPLIERALESVRAILGMDVAYIAHVRRDLKGPRSSVH